MDVYRQRANSGDSSRSRSPRSRSTRSSSPEFEAAEMNNHPHQINMDQLMEALATLTQQGLNAQANVTAMANAVQAQMAHPPAARPAPLPNLGPKTFTELDLSSGSEASKISKLCAWESSISYNIASIDGLREDLPLERLVAGILGSLKGECQTMSQGMDPGRYAVNHPNHANVQGANQREVRRNILAIFFSDLSNILLGASVPEKAYTLFVQRKQKKGEAIHPYHAELGVLYRKAFPVAHNQPENQRALIRHFLGNLWDKALAYDVNINQAMPATYQEALQLLEQRHGAWERYRMEYGDKAGPSFFGHQRDGASGGGGGNQRGEPMDVDAVRRGRGRAPNRGGGAKERQGNGKGKSQGDRREVAAKAAKPQPKYQNNPDGCFNCGDKGHRVRECPRKVAALDRGRRTEEAEEDSEPEHFSYEREPTSESEDDDWTPDRVIAALQGSENGTQSRHRSRSRTPHRASSKQRRHNTPIQGPSKLELRTRDSKPSGAGKEDGRGETC